MGLAKAAANFLLAVVSEYSWGQSRSDGFWETGFGSDTLFFLNPLELCDLYLEKHRGLVGRAFTMNFLGSRVETSIYAVCSVTSVVSDSLRSHRP